MCSVARHMESIMLFTLLGLCVGLAAGTEAAVVKDFPSIQSVPNSIPTSFSQNSQIPSPKTINKIKTKIQVD